MRDVAPLRERLGQLALVVIHQRLVHHHQQRLARAQCLEDAASACKRLSKSASVLPGFRACVADDQRCASHVSAQVGSEAEVAATLSASGQRNDSELTGR